MHVEFGRGQAEFVLIIRELAGASANEIEAQGRGIKQSEAKPSAEVAVSAQSPI